jgi:hypothetical protein
MYNSLQAQLHGLKQSLSKLSMILDLNNKAEALF